MKKLSLALIALFVQMISALAQSSGTDSSSYASRKLHVDEVNLVSSYYSQNGNHSAVTGGIGTEQLTDIANSIDLKLIGRDNKNRIRGIGLELGIDHYTSASSDKIDPNTISSASSHDTRVYPSLSYTLTDETKNYSLGAIGSYSHEFDYTSFGIGINGSKTSKDKNREFALKLQAYFDTWTVIYPIELRTGGGTGRNRTQGTSPRDSYSASFSYSQVINKRFQIAVLLDLIDQTGLLATKYQRVYFTDQSEKVENLPNNRFKTPIGIRANYFLGDRIILRGYYRYYTDDWGIKAHTASLEVPVKINPYFSVAPLYRYYTQTAGDHFAPYGMHDPTETYYTSDYDLSAFSSQFVGLNVRISPEKGVFGIQHFSMLELRYGHYMRSDGLKSDVVALNLRFK